MLMMLKPLRLTCAMIHANTLLILKPYILYYGMAKRNGPALVMYNSLMKIFKISQGWLHAANLVRTNH